MITLRMKLKSGNVEVGQRYLAAAGPLSGSRIHVSGVYEGGCVLTADRGLHITPRYRTYRITEDSFVGSMKGGRNTTADRLVLLNGKA